MKRTQSRRAAFLRKLTEDKRAVLRFMPDDFASMLEQIPLDEARDEIRHFMECMARRGYGMADLAEVLADEQ